MLPFHLNGVAVEVVWKYILNMWKTQNLSQTLVRYHYVVWNKPSHTTQYQNDW